MWVSRRYSLSILIVVASASPVHPSLVLNVMTVALKGSRPTHAGAPPTPPMDTEPLTFKPHLEISADGFDSASMPDARSSDKVPIEEPKPTSRSGLIHLEVTATGFENSADAQPTSNPAANFTNFRTTSSSDDFRTLSPSDRHRPHLESSVSGWDPHPVSSLGSPNPRITPLPGAPPPVAPPIVTVNGNTLHPIVLTSVIIDSVTLTPGGETVEFGEAPSATQIHLDPSGHPVVVIDSSTSTVQIPATIEGQIVTSGGSPITIGSGLDQSTISINEAGETIAVVGGQTSTLHAATTQAFQISDIAARAIANEYQYVIGSSTLSFGRPATIDGTVVALTTDTSGSSILIAGESTTALPALAPAPTISSVENKLPGLSTTIIAGTTQYIVESQTLSPDHLVTVGGTVFSVAGTTLVVVGDKSTTISAHATTALSTRSGVTTSGIVGTGEGNPTPTSATSAALELEYRRWNLWGILVWGILGVRLGLG